MNFQFVKDSSQLNQSSGTHQGKQLNADNEPVKQRDNAEVRPVKKSHFTRKNKPSMLRDTCFSCREKGYFIKNCSKKNNLNYTSISAVSATKKEEVSVLTQHH